MQPLYSFPPATIPHLHSITVQPIEHYTTQPVFHLFSLICCNKKTHKPEHSIIKKFGHHGTGSLFYSCFTFWARRYMGNRYTWDVLFFPAAFTSGKAGQRPLGVNGFFFLQRFRQARFDHQPRLGSALDSGCSSKRAACIKTHLGFYDHAMIGIVCCMNWSLYWTWTLRAIGKVELNSIRQKKSIAVLATGYPT